jgi:hypothetical protein
LILAGIILNFDDVQKAYGTRGYGVVDTGATHSICNNLNLFNFIKPIPPLSIKLGDNTIIPSLQAVTLTVNNFTITALYDH